MPAPQDSIVRAAKQIARFIVRKGMKPGDRLSPQPQFRAAIGMRNDTICAAMRELSQLGVLERKSRVGTVIQSIDALRGLPWTIGVAGIHAPERGPRAFYADLLYRLLGKLSAGGIDPRVYFRNPCYQHPNALADFPRLADNIESGDLDALVMLTHLREADRLVLDEHDIPLCHLYEWESMPCAVLQDLGAFVGDAAAQLATAGCRRLLLVNSYAEMNPVQPLIQAVESALAAAPGRRPAFAHCACLYGQSAGAELSRKILAHPPRQRPDGLVFTDDYSALGAASVFADTGDRPPRFAVKTNRHLPLSFPVPVTCFEIDTDELADRAVTLVVDRLLHAAPADAVVRVRATPTVRGGTARQNVTTSTLNALVDGVVAFSDGQS
jgi:DNA-binding LacI/PurR family transcriptional regulator